MLSHVKWEDRSPLTTKIHPRDPPHPTPGHPVAVRLSECFGIVRLCGFGVFLVSGLLCVSCVFLLCLWRVLVWFRCVSLCLLWFRSLSALWSLRRRSSFCVLCCGFGDISACFWSLVSCVLSVCYLCVPAVFLVCASVVSMCFYVFYCGFGVFSGLWITRRRSSFCVFCCVFSGSACFWFLVSWVLPVCSCCVSVYFAVVSVCFWSLVLLSPFVFLRVLLWFWCGFGVFMVSGLLCASCVFLLCFWCVLVWFGVFLYVLRLFRRVSDLWFLPVPLIFLCVLVWFRCRSFLCVFCCGYGVNQCEPVRINANRCDTVETE
jgi:hypothetical protein